MSKQLPALLANFNVFVDTKSYAGTAEDVDLPEIVRKVEDFRAAGMLGDVGVDLGYEKLEMSVIYKGVDSRHFEQLSKCGVSDLPIRYLGAYERKDTCEDVIMEVYVRGQVMNLDLGNGKLGELNDTELKYNLTYIRVDYDGITHLELDIVNGKEFIAGRDRNADRRARLGL